ncbi:adenylate/guanylate cyclase domain-containing protein [Flaviflexus salsibiostraticola]|uniref:Adenylate/guanylate cyclase domain-containing protein n=1 Tax=Flaviflexus salsibiostraticola TaxID=1282737 RepID=A0A3Q8WUR9_9ACTO|nr:adenylate/guanylate cyclase domain-containing protein [Flaviflexus salsibiostraticola]AZN30824.1 adenylate/guanylate cyclase domain-containing protein [Flaviflexus salsibiostraticola]
MTRDTDLERTRLTVEARANSLLNGQPQFTLVEAAERLAVEPRIVRRFWTAMGFPAIEDEENDRIFTGFDIEMMRRHFDKLSAGQLDATTLNSLVLAQGHMADRLALWQHEALVEFAQTTFEIDDIAARYWVIDHIDDYLQLLEDQMRYVWRRHMAAFLRRSDLELRRRGPEKDTPDLMPLQRAVGFIDLVAFTSKSRELGSDQLVTFIRDFEFTCREIITENGARLVKTLGDAVIFIADDVKIGAKVVTELVHQLGRIEGMLPVRASLLWGRVVSSFGDIFGPTVNLASRLVDIADEGTILIDRATYTALGDAGRSTYMVLPYGQQELGGTGKVEIFELKRFR